MQPFLLQEIIVHILEDQKNKIKMTRWWQLNFFLNFPPENWGKISYLTNICQMGWFNHQPDDH